MKRTIAVAIIGLLPGIAFSASPLRLECSAEQSLPGRALVCEYTMLGRLNEQLADAHDEIVRLGKAGRVEVKTWLTARDACMNVECLDRLFGTGMREARLALVEVESRQPTPVLTNARGEVLRVAKIATKPVTRSTTAPLEALPVRERSPLDTAASLLLVFFLVAAFAYALLARRLAG